MQMVQNSTMTLFIENQQYFHETEKIVRLRTHYKAIKIYVTVIKNS